MTNGISATILLILLVAFGCDYFLNDSAATVFLLRKFMNLIVYVEFWR